MVRQPLHLLLSRIAEKPRLEDLVVLRRELLRSIEETCGQGILPLLATARRRLCEKAVRDAIETMEAALSLLDKPDGRTLALNLLVPAWWETTGEEPLVPVRILKSFSIEDKDFQAHTIALLKTSFAHLLVRLGLAVPVESRR